MNSNQISQQLKSDPKGKANVSLVLGIISIMPTIILIILIVKGLINGTFIHLNLE
jgi:hypothetical protein